MSEETRGLLETMIVLGSKHSQQRLEGIGDHLYQGLATVNTNMIQQHGSVTDDSGLIAALQTASRSPAGLGGN